MPIYSQVTYTGNGSTTQYNISFNFIDSSHVKAFLDGVETTAFTISSSTLTFTSAPANGVTIRIERQTPIDARLIDFTDGSVLTEADLDRSADQNFFVAQEITDDQTNNLQLDTDDKYDANSKVIKNVANPTNNQDAVTKFYLENTWLSPSDKTNLTTVAGISSDVTTVAGISSNVTTVAGNNANVTTVAGISSDVTSVAGISSDVTAVAGDATDIGTVATDLAGSDNVGTVAGAIANINTVAGSISNLNTVAGNNSNVTTVATNISSVNTVATNINDIVTVANDLNEAVSEIETVASDLQEAQPEIDLVAGSITNVNTVGGAIANVNTVAGISSNVSTVAGISSDVTTVAGNDANITTVAGANSNISTVAGSISNVNSVAGSISNVNSVASNLASVNNFAEVYRISATAPTTSLDTGDLYFDTTSDILKVYGSSGWQNAGSSVNGTAQRYNYTATSGQTTFTGSDNNGNTLTYDAGYIDVYLNGVKLLNGTDVTVTSGSSVVLASGATTGDIVDIVAYGTFSVASLNADNLDSGTVPDARFPATLPTASGTNLTNLNASNLSSGTVSEDRLPNTSAYKNLIINGEMDLAQRGTSKTTAGSGYHTVDRWRLSKSLTADFDMAQSTDVPSGQGFSKSLKMDCTTANTSPGASNVFYLEQRLEGQNLQHLKFGTSNAEQLTLSFWVKSNKTGTWIAELVDSDNTLQVSQSYTINSANTWEKKTLTYPSNTSNSFDNDNARSLTLFFWLVSGSDYTSGTLQTTWGNTATGRAVGQVNFADSTSNEWLITGVQLESGSVASSFETLPTDINLMRCKRYFQKTFAEATTPAQNISANNFIITVVAGGSSDSRGGYFFPVEMRASPTITTFNPYATNSSFRKPNSNTDVAMSPELFPNFINFGTSGSGTTSLHGHFTVNAEL